MTAGRLLVAVVVVGGLLRFVPIWFGLPYMQARPDEETTIAHATAVLGGDLNPRFFHWPSFTFYVLAALFALASWIRAALSLDPGLTAQHHVLLARAFVAAAGTLTIIVIFRLGRRMAGSTVGLLAALFLAVSLLHVRESHFAMTDVLMTLLLTLSLGMLLRGLDAEAGTPGEVRWFALAGLAGGLATSTKYSAAAVVAAMAAGQVVLLARHRAIGPVWRPAAWLPAGVFLTTFAAAFVAGSPYAALDYQRFAVDFAFNIKHLSEGHIADLGRGWTYHLRRSLPYGAGIATGVAAIVGVVPLARHYHVHALVLGGFTAAFYISIGSGRTVFFRYVLPLIPVVSVAAAVGVWHAGRWLAPRTGLSSRAAVGLLGALVAIPAAINCVWFDALLAKTDTRVLAARWMIAHAEPTQSLFEAPDAYIELDLGRAVHRWHFDMESESFLNAGGRVPDWLVLHESPLWTYVRIPAALRRLAAEKYALAHTVRGTRGAARSAVYDLQDAFFMPLSRLSTVERPGPTILIYRRAGD